MSFFPFVSVIIPMYNASRYIEETIQSVLDQTWSNIEIIVVDDGSTDDSYDIVANIRSNKIRLFHQDNQGAPKARNFGFLQSKGEYIQYLDADDLLSPSKIEQQLQALISSKNEIAFSTFYQYINGEIKPEWYNLQFTNRSYDSALDLQVDLWRYFIPSYVPGCYLISRNLIEKTGEWNQSLLKNQDGEYLARVFSHAAEIVFVPNEYVLWRLVENSISHTHSVKKAQSVIDSYKSIAKILLQNSLNLYTNNAIAIAFGYLLYYDVMTFKQSYDVLQFLREHYIKPLYPSNSSVFRFFTKLFNPIIGRIINEYYIKIKNRI